MTTYTRARMQCPECDGERVAMYPSGRGEVLADCGRCVAYDGETHPSDGYVDVPTTTTCPDCGSTGVLAPHHIGTKARDDGTCLTCAGSGTVPTRWATSSQPLPQPREESTMSDEDIVKRLRHAQTVRAQWGARWASLGGEAADEIERLRAIIDALDITRWEDGIRVGVISSSTSHHPTSGPIREWLDRTTEEDQP